MNNITCNYKPRFKALEGFFRRIAYNLGNSPSQTEVKIISCIPIDVTDLQQKICQLQQELQAAKQLGRDPNDCSPQSFEPRDRSPHCCNSRDRTPLHTTICNQSLCSSRVAKYSSHPDAGLSDRCCPDSASGISIGNPGPSAKLLKSNASFVRSTALDHGYPLSSRIINISKTERSTTRSLFSRKKRPPKKKAKTQIVYCAQSKVNSPFQTTFSLSDVLTSKNYSTEANTPHKDAPLSSSYLADIVQRQYKPQPIFDLSDFSSPICRDNVSSVAHSLPIDSDVCSCCHGQFHNIDYHINHRNTYEVYPTCESAGNTNRSAYYDSNLYDLVPVKENPVKKNQINEIENKTDRKKRAIQPDPVRTKLQTAPYSVHYCTMSSMRDHNVNSFSAKTRNKKDIVLKKMSANSGKDNSLMCSQRDRDLCCVDYSPVYTKRPIKQRKQAVSTIGNKKRSFATCMPITTNNAGCQTASAPVGNPNEDGIATISETPPLSENKTETTLNQIKKILQSVLTEVKETKLGKPAAQPKTDAVVGPSQGNMHGDSQLLQSYTYSPYSMNPYIPSCSHQMPPNNCIYPSLQERCMLQFPLLVQPQKQICTNCFKNSNTCKHENAASAATNTEIGRPHGRNSETEHLIKEIYKSMAITLEKPSSEDNTVGDYTKINTSKYSSEKPVIDKDSKQIAKAISDIFRNSKPLETTDTRDTDETIASKLVSKNAAVGSKSYWKKYRMHNYSQNITSTTESADREKEQLFQALETEIQSDTTIVNEDTDQSSTDSATESDDVVVRVKESVVGMDSRKGKKGIFQKMLKIFQPKQRQSIKEDEEDDESENESDSDDYQTVYSHKSAAPVLRKVSLRSRPHSKVFNSKQLQQRRSRTISPEKRPRVSPYSEQEYRRHWNEKLMFHDNQSKIYNRVLRESTPGAKRPIYYQNYEARDTVIDPIKHAPLRMPGNAMTKQCVINNNLKYNTRGNRPNILINNLSKNNQRTSCVKSSAYYSGYKPHIVTVQHENSLPGKGLAWLKSRKLGIRCGPQWKELLING